MSHTEADQPGQSEQSAAVGERLTAVETEQKRQGGILERIEQALAGGKTPARDLDEDRIGELVRKGAEKLRAEDEAKAAKEAEQAQRADHDARLAALEERPPSETAATPTGKLRASLQRWGFGIDQPHK